MPITEHRRPHITAYFKPEVTQMLVERAKTTRFGIEALVYIVRKNTLGLNRFVGRFCSQTVLHYYQDVNGLTLNDRLKEKFFSLDPDSDLAIAPRVQDPDPTQLKAAFLNELKLPEVNHTSPLKVYIQLPDKGCHDFVQKESVERGTTIGETVISIVSEYTWGYATSELVNTVNQLLYT